MKGKLPIRWLCRMIGHRKCNCDSCKPDKRYPEGRFGRICGRCDGDY